MFSKIIVLCIHNKPKTVCVDYARELVKKIGNERSACILSDARNNGASTSVFFICLLIILHLHVFDFLNRFCDLNICLIGLSVNL